MVTHTVDSVGVGSLARILGVMGLVWGLLVGITWLVIGVGGGPFPGFAELLLAIVGGAVYGVVGGAISAIVYNLAATVVGGIQLEITSKG